ncbi:hypothetical protein C8R44DRAFT_758615 [Mycena epipterygia]|nr:hypothetical protein C8R44DRAFT_758615 [Mycena epipterygia]
MSSFTFSNNLVEIGALTALVGSSVAESLILGNRGSAGVAWGATSSFGTISVVRACFAGACSGWLRESLGVRTTASDEAVGFELAQDSNRAGNLRRSMSEPLAIFCHNGRNVKTRAWTDVYAMDHRTSLMLRGMPDTAIGHPIQVFAYADYIFCRYRYALFQVPVLLLSVSKLVEVYVLRMHGASLLLRMVSAMPWIFFFLGAIVMETHEFLLGRKREPEFGERDIIAGQLPMAGRRGGIRKIVVGGPEDPRATTLTWRLFWAVGAAVSAASIILSYVAMAQEPRATIFIWTGFQLLWLGVRILVYHLAEPVNPMFQRLLVIRPWETLSADLKDRVVNLTLALGKSQTFVHPRGHYQYAEDAFTLRILRLVQNNPAPGDVYPLPTIHLPTARVEIAAIVGDTALSAAMWMTGSKTAPMDLYDSCVVVFVVPDAHRSAQRTVAVPAARVLSGVTFRPADVEAERGTPVFVPKGASNTGAGLVWWYWVPCAAGLWLEIRVPISSRAFSEQGLTVLGTHEASVRSDSQVSALLAAGKLNIGLKNVGELKDVVELSRKARNSFLELLT